MTEKSLSDSTRLRLLLLIPGGFALLAGLDAALLLLGLSAPVTASRLADVHGILMVYSFVGTVVALERSVALGRLWGFLAPAGLGFGGVLLILVPNNAVGGAAVAVGSAALAALYVPLWRRNAATAVLAQAWGGVIALGGAVMYAAGVPIPWILPWLAGFLVLTIAGERLELARVAFLVQNVEGWALAASAAYFVAIPASLLWPDVGYRVMGVTLILLTAWLLRYDVAGKTIRSTGLPRFSAACLLSGYVWLLVAGGVWIVAGPVRSGPAYDASAHAVFLGFVISMIMAHAPIILPAVLRRPLPYRPIMYAPAILLHASLLLRIVVGDGADQLWAVQAGGVLNVVAVLGFVVIAVASVVIRTSPARPAADRVKAAS
ncbi:hypothetical protein [Gordonia phthalatica]|uniref:Uncharacterized protein n=1 Tax=Gordonia phthalatica TaxID=1136941 RepID=A0A0N9NHI5_9ACTN|nr:hypothetical protein [Gordonia phthalatica]ALG86649.1 hypothetical protein ACH46_05995 [Gordonia phthalatica]